MRPTLCEVPSLGCGFDRVDIPISLGIALGGPGGEVLVTVGMELIVPKGDDGKERVITLRVYLLFTSFEYVVHAEWWCSGRGQLGR